MKDIQNILQKVHVQFLNKKNISSRVVCDEKYTILILQTISIKHNQLNQKSRKFLFLHDDIYEFEKSENSFKTINNFDTIYLIIEQILENYNDIIEGYTLTVQKKEDELYKRDISASFLNDWLDLKRDLSKIHRILLRLEYSFSKLIKHDVKFQHLSTLLELTLASKRDCEHNLNNLDTLYSYFYSLKNEKMNNQIFILTIVSAIFLPINLIVGFFGMNTQNLFFDKDPNGTWYIVYIMIGIVIFIILFIPTIRFFNRIIHTKLYGKLRFYKNLKNIIERAENRDLF